MKYKLLLNACFLFNLIMVSTIFADFSGKYLCTGTNTHFYSASTVASTGKIAWVYSAGAGSRCAVNSLGEILVVGGSNRLYCSTDAVTWVNQPNLLAIDVSVAVGRYAYVGTDNKIYLYSGTMPSTKIFTWTPIDDNATRVAINSNGQMLKTAKDGSLWYSAGWNGSSANWVNLGITGVAGIACALNRFAYFLADGSMFFGGAPVNNSIAFAPDTSLKDKGIKVIALAIASDGQRLCVGQTNINNIMYNVMYFSSNDGQPWLDTSGRGAYVSLASSEGAVPTTVTTAPTVSATSTIVAPATTTVPSTTVVTAPAAPDLTSVYNSVIAVTKDQMLASSFDVVAFLARIAQLKVNATYATNATVLAQEQLALNVQLIQKLRADLQKLSATDAVGLNAILTNANYMKAASALR